ncbi:MAG: isoleucine--tRNA ligase [archaeon]
MTDAPKTINEKENEILNFWDKDKTFEKSLKQTKGKEEFVFYDGPPFATGLPHYGHLLASMEKDVIPRFWTMKGKHVRRVWGWDCHGLPIENIAEKELKINSKDEIEKMGVEKFNAFCRSKVLSYADDWAKVVRRMGRWVDMKNAYKTMDNEYIESVWWVFKQMWDKDLIYEGEKILMYCPRCSTPLAKSEIAMGDSYQVKKDETITVKFKLKDEDVYALAWTTTPWTLPSNLALTVNPNLTYVYLKDKKDGTTYLLAKELISKFYKSQEDYEITKEVLGEKLKGVKYEPLFPYFAHLKNSFRILLGDFVTAEDGTGIVHTAPAFGEEDYYVCKANGIDFVSPVDERGRFTKEVTDYAGQYIFDTNIPIIIELKKQGKIVKIEKKEHEYPFCYRCDTPLFYKAMPALFVNIAKIKDNLIKANKEVNWHPEFLKEGRVNHTFVTAPDWNISRNRFWAASIPVWKSKSGKTKVLGSIEELKKYAINLPKDKMDLHKDFVDKVKIKIDGEEMTRIPDVFDCWFESGSMPYAQLHYPFENKDIFEKMYPADFVAEGLDQTRGWFYTLAVIGNALFEKAPFKNVLVHGLILAEDGKKMSKKLSNYPDPMTVIEKYGVDALRFYLLGSIVMNADNFNFSEKGLEEVYKKVLMLLYNVDNFYSLYPNIKEKTKANSKNILDKWILSRLNDLNKKVDESYQNYDPIKVCSEIKFFVEDLSTWYVRRNRNRFSDGDVDAKTTLKEVLSTFSKIIAPLMPFIAEMIYQNLGNKDSVHLQEWPKYDSKKIDEKLNQEMKETREIVSIALRERDIQKLPLKQPLSEVKLHGYELSKEHEEIILEELNIKKITLVKSKE